MPANSSIFHVRSGESLSLKVRIVAYPKPHISWSFKGHELRNTTDHVITTHSDEYRCDSTQAHTCFVLSKCWKDGNITFSQVYFRWISGLAAGHIPFKYTVETVNSALGFLVKQELSDCEWLSWEIKPWYIWIATYMLQIEMCILM